MKNRSLKRNILSASLAAVLALGLAACSGGRELSVGKNTDADFPYAWEEHKKGTYTISVTGNRPEQFTWDCFSDCPDFVTVSYDGERKGASVFTVTPLEEGPASVTLRLTDTSLPVDSGALLRFSFEVDSEKHMALVASSSSSIASCIVEEAGDSTVCWTDGGRNVRLCFVGEHVWLSKDDSDRLIAVGPTEEENCVSFAVYALEPGEGTISFICPDSGSRCTLTVVSDGETLTVKDCATGRYEPEPVIDPDFITDEELERLRKEYPGKIYSLDGMLDDLTEHKDGTSSAEPAPAPQPEHAEPAEPPEDTAPAEPGELPEERYELDIIDDAAEGGN